MSYTHGHGSGLNHKTTEVNSTTEVAVVAGKITVNRKFCWMLGTILIIPQQKYLNICKTGCVHIPSHTIFRNAITLAFRNPKNYVQFSRFWEKIWFMQQEFIAIFWCTKSRNYKKCPFIEICSQYLPLISGCESGFIDARKLVFPGFGLSYPRIFLISSLVQQQVQLPSYRHEIKLFTGAANFQFIIIYFQSLLIVSSLLIVLVSFQSFYYFFMTFKIQRFYR